ncbi:unnamed protein product [Ectocarpus sp. CCAP 1310/34]|nr:unnamed protein product [Ectocarpus sp. CCAP 1310/34]
MSSSAAAPAPPPDTCPQSLTVTPPKFGDAFACTRSLRIAAERAMLASGRTLVSDHRVTGGHQRLYRCSGAIMEKGTKNTGGCQAHVRANKRRDKHFHVTSASFEHQNCVGGKKKPSVAALAAEGAAVVHANRKVTAPGLAKTLKGTFGVELKSWSAHRLKRRVIGDSKEEQAEGIQRFQSYMDLLATDSSGTITNCEWDAQGHLERAFLMLGPVAHFATTGVPQVACMDFCHMTGEWNGVIGAICVKSSNNNIVQLATCIAPKENAAAYEYLIDNACRNDEVATFLNKPTTSIISDKHKGSESAVPCRLDQSEHLRCVEHMLKNAGTVGPEGRMFMYEAARAPDKAS